MPFIVFMKNGRKYQVDKHPTLEFNEKAREAILTGEYGAKACLFRWSDVEAVVEGESLGLEQIPEPKP